MEKEICEIMNDSARKRANVIFEKHDVILKDALSYFFDMDSSLHQDPYLYFDSMYSAIDTKIRSKHKTFTDSKLRLYPIKKIWEDKKYRSWPFNIFIDNLFFIKKDLEFIELRLIFHSICIVQSYIHFVHNQSSTLKYFHYHEMIYKDSLFSNLFNRIEGDFSYAIALEKYTEIQKFYVFLRATWCFDLPIEIKRHILSQLFSLCEIRPCYTIGLFQTMKISLYNKKK